MEGVNYIIDEIKKRLHEKDQNYLAIFCGPTGSGKSLASISLAIGVNPNFKTNTIVFSANEFLELLNSGTLKQGDVIIWEEIGTSMDSRTFMSVQNRAISYCFETFRWLNLGVIMNLPGLGMVDKRVKEVLHQYFQTLSIDRKRNICYCGAYNVQYNSRRDELYFKYPIDDHNQQVDVIGFKKPSLEYIYPYLSKKKSFTKRLYNELHNQLNPTEVQDEKDLTSIVDGVLKEPKKFLKKWGKRIIVDQPLIEAEYGIGFRDGQKVRSLVLAKENISRLV